MREGDFYLSKYDKDSYSYSSVNMLLDGERKRLQGGHGMPKREPESNLPKEPGWKEKLHAVQNTLREFMELETFLQDKGGRTFQKLHPELVAPDKMPPSEDNKVTAIKRNWEPTIRFEYRMPRSFSVNLPSSYSSYHPENYVELFEAVWQRDAETVKRITLLPSKDTTGKRCSPLNITVQDRHSDCPFAIALSLGRYDIARTIYHIAEAQYKPLTAHIKNPDTESIDEGSSDVESSDYDNMSDEAAELAEARFEELAALLEEDDMDIDDIRKVKRSVGSPIPPALMFDWPCPKSVERWKSTSASPCPKRQGISPWNMTAMALYQDDLDMLSCVLDLAEMPGKKVVGEDRKPIRKGNSFALNDHVFRVALQSASPSTLAELIKRTAAGFLSMSLLRKVE